MVLVYAKIAVVMPEGGWGIGLSICKTIILAHGGDIVGRNYTDGAEVSFWLPLEGEENESENISSGYRR